MILVVGRRLSEAEMAELRSILGSGELRVERERARILEQVTDAEAYVPGPWDPEVFGAAERLRWVHFLWAGVERALFPALVESDVTVTNSAGVFAVPMAEHAMAMILALCRGLNRCIRRPGDWAAIRRELSGALGELHGATLGVIGYGGIGRATARRARAFGVRVLAIRSRPGDSDGVADSIWGADRLDDLLRRSDYVLVSCPLNDRTRGLIGAREFALMKPRAVIVNLARGAVIDQDALIEALKEGRIGGAGLDVTSPEPLPPESPLWQMENVIVTPHVSGTAPSTWRYQFDLLRQNVERYVRGEPLLNVVDKKAGY